MASEEHGCGDGARGGCLHDNRRVTAGQGECEASMIKMLAASANVCTLRSVAMSKKKSARLEFADGELVGKAQILEMTFNEAELDIIGIQEGRAMTSSVVSGTHYVQHISQADATGNFGSQLWVHRRLQMSVKCTVSPSTRVIGVQGWSRLLKRSIVAVSAHAPCEDAAVDAKDKFWIELYGAVSQLVNLSSGARIILCIDANARTGSIKSDHIGDKQPDSENDNGGRLRGMLESCRLIQHLL